MTKQTQVRSTEEAPARSALKLAQAVAMNREDIIRMAREAGLHEARENPPYFGSSALTLERFAELVRAGERERIITANAPEIERINDALKKLSEENTKLWGWYHDAEQHIAILQRRARGEIK